ncbi:unnamed protein product [Vicia faba]|uniref:Uncharacterized protein n=1 Tax=Vicia faba TaxID=3906 RepID=A0AAV1AJZ9_VICFA|nr:unnamed protein product [Vicia faba]
MTEPASCSQRTKKKKSPTLGEITIGIDIGTSPCSISIWNGFEIEVFKETLKEMIKSPREVFKDDAFSIGVSSEVTLSSEHEDTLFKLKRLFDIVDSDSAVYKSVDFPFLMHTLDIKVHPFIAAFVNKVWRSTTAVELLEKFLVELRLMVGAQLKRPIRNVVFAVPVSFSRLQLYRIHCACAKAGLKVIRTMPQPTAVALLYALDHSVSEISKMALIFNMDSGYCDVAVTAIAAGKCRIKALTGSSIGGEDLLGNMICHLVPDSVNRIKKRIHEDTEIKSMALLRCTIQEAITRLSSQTSVEVDLDMGDDLKIHKVVTREQFEEVNKEVFDKCERLIIQCLHDAKVEVDDINDVIIVGGCYNIPKVKNLVTKICKRKELYTYINPFEGAIYGAAVAGAIASGIRFMYGKLQLFDFHATLVAIGIRANGNNFVPVIPRNTSLPTTRHVACTTIHDNQNAALIVVYEGEGQKAEENHLLGYFKITEIPEASKGVPEINVCMEIDRENRLTVTASVWMPGALQSAIPVSVAGMTKFAGEQHAWSAESLIRRYGDSMDLVTLVN